MKRPIAAACAFIALLASPSLALAPERPTEAAIDRFLESLPDLQSDGSIDQSELDRLAGLNAGRTEDIRLILDAHGACLSAAAASITRNMFREAAIVLGARNLARMTEYFEGPIFRRLAARAKTGDELSDTEMAEMERLLSAYPTAEFQAVLEAEAMRVVRNPESMAAAGKCWQDRDSALIQKGLRQK